MSLLRRIMSARVCGRQTAGCRRAVLSSAAGAGGARAGADDDALLTLSRILRCSRLRLTWTRIAQTDMIALFCASVHCCTLLTRSTPRVAACRVCLSVWSVARPSAMSAAGQHDTTPRQGRAARGIFVWGVEKCGVRMAAARPPSRQSLYLHDYRKCHRSTPGSRSPQLRPVASEYVCD